MEAGPREDFAGIVQKGYPHMDKQSQIFSEENCTENFNTIKIQHLRSCLLKPYVIEKWESQRFAMVFKLVQLYNEKECLIQKHKRKKETKKENKNKKKEKHEA